MWLLVFYISKIKLHNFHRRLAYQNKEPFFTQRVLEVLHDGGFPSAVLALHVVGGHEARLVGGIADPPPGLGVVQEPEAFVLLDVQLLVLLGHVVKLGNDNHLFRHP